MKKSWNLFLRDCKRLTRNVVALIIVVGISVLPCFYAWFNIGASWDPYGSTKDIKIAVASNDKGYTGTILPASVNIGDTLISKLRANSKLGWTFVDEEEAREGVESGEYYAAIIIPADFSQKMLSVFSDQVENPQITYYYNAKKNAISPKVTDKGSKTIQTMVNTTFNETLSNVLISAMKTLTDSSDGSGTDDNLTTVANNLLSNMTEISTDLSMLSGTVDSFVTLNQSLQTLLNTTNTFISESQKTLQSDSTSIGDNGQTISNLQANLDATLTGLEQAMDSTQAAMEEMQSVLDSDMKDASARGKELGASMRECAEVAGSLQSAFDTIDEALETLKANYPDYADSIASLQTIVKNMSFQQADLKDRLIAAADSCENAPGDLQSTLDSIISDLQNVTAQVKSNAETYRQSIKSKLSDLNQKIVTAQNSISLLLTNLDTSVTNVNNTVGTMSQRLGQVNQALNDTKTIIDQARQSSDTFQTELRNVLNSQDYSKLKTMLGGDSTSIAKFLSSPVSLNTVKVFPIEKYGSAMAPFYTALSIWVGGIVLAAMLKTSPGKEDKKLKPWQFYIGRYMIFLVLGLVQTTLICLGDLYFLGIQCSSPFLFMCAGWLASIVYVNIVYTLTVSFGAIGKALAVILMVMQVAGSGGTFPIETTPEIFQHIFPYLPFVHTMDMMRETIGGFYGNTYVKNAGELLIFLLISLFFGIFLRRPIMIVTNWVGEQLEKTKVIE